MEYPDEKTILKQILSALSKGYDTCACSILKENDKTLCLRSIKKIYSFILNSFIDSLETFYFLLNNSSHRNDINYSDNDNLAIRIACERGYAEIYKILIYKENVDPSSKTNEAIQNACKNGHIEIVKLLLADTRVDPCANNNYALKDACENGHIEIVKLLIADTRVNPSTSDNYSLKIACQNNRIEIVKLLLENKRVIHRNNNAPYVSLVNACAYGHTELVKMLLKNNNIMTKQNNLDLDYAFKYSLIYACENRNIGVVELLLEFKKFYSTRDSVREAIGTAYLSGYDEIGKIIIDKFRQNNCNE